MVADPEINVGLPSKWVITQFVVNLTLAVVRANFVNTRPVASAMKMMPVTAWTTMTVFAGPDFGFITPYPIVA